MRQISDTEVRSLKTATRALIQRVGGLHAAATVTRVNASVLAEYYDPNAAERLVPADVAADLERVAGEPVVTAQLARMAGHALLPLQAGQGTDAAAIGRVFAECGQLGAAWAAAMEDGRISAVEAERLMSELADLQRAAGAALALLHAKRGTA